MSLPQYINGRVIKEYTVNQHCATINKNIHVHIHALNSTHIPDLACMYTYKNMSLISFQVFEKIIKERLKHVMEIMTKIVSNREHYHNPQ